MNTCRLLLCLLMLSPFAPARGAAEIIADLNQGFGLRFDASPRGFVRLDQLSYFSACDRLHGCELWQSDGTAAGTRLVADICPGQCSSAPAGLAVTFGDSIYFSADDGERGTEPWVYRPALGAPRRLDDLNPGTVGSAPFGFVSVASGNMAGVFFVAQIGREGFFDSNALFRVTESGGQFNISQVLAPGELRSIGKPVALGDRLYFRATSDTLGTGSELWTLQAPSPNVFSPEAMGDIFPGSTGASIDALTPHPLLGRVFFRASDAQNNSELWSSNGSLAGTAKVKEIGPGAAGSFPSSLAVVGSQLFFSANDSDLSNNAELWVSDGTSIGTQKVLEIHPNTAVGSSPVQIHALGGQAVFLANNGTNGYEFWRSNGSPAGTARIADLLPGSSGLLAAPSSSRGAAVAAGFLYVSNGDRVFRTDGSEAGTRFVGNALPDPLSGYEQLHAAGDRVLMAASTLSQAGELFQTRIDSPTSISQVNVIGDEIGHSDPRHFFRLAAGDVMYADDDDIGYEWRSLPAAGGALPLADTFPFGAIRVPLVNAGPVRSDPGSDIDRIWFVMNFDELWLSDGTPEGTRLVFDAGEAERALGNINCVAARGEGVVFLTRNFSPERVEIWESDGTPEGTRDLLRPENTPFGITLDDVVMCPVVVGESILLSARQAATGREIHRSNGNPGNLSLLRDIVPGSVSSFPRDFVRAGSRTFFVASDESSDANLELWVTDGTAQGTRQVIDLNPQSGSRPNSLTAFGNELLFSANDGSTGFELYRSDASTEGTQRVADLYPGSGSALPPFGESDPSPIAVSGGMAWFAASTTEGEGARHLFVTDGTQAGTRQIQPAGATRSLSPQAITALPGGGVLFSAVEDATGRELWFSDGSDSGTFLVSDIATGATSSSPIGIATGPDGAIFSANDALRGREPWRLRLSLSEQIYRDGFEQGKRAGAAPRKRHPSADQR